MKHVELSMDGNDNSNKLNKGIREILDCAAEQGKRNVQEFNGVFKHLGLSWEDYLQPRKFLPEKLDYDLKKHNIPLIQRKQFMCRMIHCVLDDSNGSLEELLIAAFN
ncbi:hypothetical protein [Paenibacillus kandeliae]|uniref:hypothetical protein n=1 Tax=Paenibacillus kandeliae TaxID=3231269 RepID=UPI00345AFD73